MLYCGAYEALDPDDLYLEDFREALNRHITLYQMDVAYGKIATIIPQRRNIAKLVVSHPVEKVERRTHA